MKRIIILIITMMLVVSACGRAENISGDNEKRIMRMLLLKIINKKTQKIVQT